MFLTLVLIAAFTLGELRENGGFQNVSLGHPQASRPWESPSGGRCRAAAGGTPALSRGISPGPSPPGVGFFTIRAKNRKLSLVFSGPTW